MKTIFITGSSRGIGYTVGGYLEKKNYNVIYNGRGDCPENIQNYVKGDVNDINLLKTVIQLHGKIDILINNAGILTLDDSENIQEEIDTNLISCVHFCKQAEQLEIEKVINITSGSALNCPEDISIYGWTKYALEGLTKFMVNKGNCSFVNFRIDMSLKTHMTEGYFNKNNPSQELKPVETVLPCMFMIIKMSKEECNGKTFSLQRFLKNPRFEKLFQNNCILSKEILEGNNEVTLRENVDDKFHKCLGTNPLGTSYPKDEKVDEVLSLLSKELDLPKSNLLLINGGISASVDLLAKIFVNEGDKVLSLGLMFPPLMASFFNRGGMFDFTQTCFTPPGDNSKSCVVDCNLNLKHVKSQIKGAKLVYLTNPFFLSGGMLSKYEFDNLIKLIPKNVIIVIDECYIEYASRKDICNGVNLLKEEYKPWNIICLRTFSKFYGLGDARIGYIISNANVIQLLSMNLSWKNIPLSSLEGIKHKLNDNDFKEKSYNLNKGSIKYIEKELSKLNINYVQSQSNSMLIQLPRVGMSLNHFKDICKDEGIILPENSIIGESFIYQIGEESFNKKLIKILGNV